MERRLRIPFVVMMERARAEVRPYVAQFGAGQAIARKSLGL